MTTQAIQKDEDLIILSDDSSSDTSLLDFNFDVKSDIENSTIEPTITFAEDVKTEDISFDFDLGTENTSSIIEEKVDTLGEVSEISTTDDLFNLGTEVQNDVSTQEIELVETKTNDVDFGFSNETTSTVSDDSLISDSSSKVFNLEAPVLETTIQSSFSRNDILDETVSKMQQRKDIISQTKSSKQSKVDELNEQIKKLKKEASDFESEIKDLEKEDSALDLDISSIEKMKSSVLEVSADRTRKHNLDNIKKK